MLTVEDCRDWNSLLNRSITGLDKITNVKLRLKKIDSEIANDISLARGIIVSITAGYIKQQASFLTVETIYSNKLILECVKHHRQSVLLPLRILSANGYSCSFNGSLELLNKYIGLTELVQRKLNSYNFELTTVPTIDVAISLELSDLATPIINNDYLVFIDLIKFIETQS